MIYSLAPMEGITGHTFRRVHAECFGELDVFLRDVCDRSPLPVSVKTRLGLESDAEYERILEL